MENNELTKAVKDCNLSVHYKMRLQALIAKNKQRIAKETQQSAKEKLRKLAGAKAACLSLLKEMKSGVATWNTVSPYWQGCIEKEEQRQESLFRSPCKMIKLPLEHYSNKGWANVDAALAKIPEIERLYKIYIDHDDSRGDVAGYEPKRMILRAALDEFEELLIKLFYVGDK